LLANHKRVARIMREDNLLAVQPRQFVVTTDSHHELEVYLNLAYRMKLTGIDQLWVADITYIRLRAEFVYLALILDGFSRKAVGRIVELRFFGGLTIEETAEVLGISPATVKRSWASARVWLRHEMSTNGHT
jgi:hypothetical protein